MDRLEVEHRFHPVGQGLFYSLSLVVGHRSSMNEPFHAVYDCGSSTAKAAWKKAVSEYAVLHNRTRRIDLLIISHLDRDHVNGLEELLGAHETRDVVLPYMAPAERLLVMASPGPKPLWYTRLLESPTKYLRAKGVDNVWYITRGGSDSIPPTPQGEEEGKVHRLEYNEFRLDFRSLEPDQEALARARVEDPAEADGATQFLTDDQALNLNQLWQFIFYAAQISDSKRLAFERCVHRRVSPLPLAEVLGDTTLRTRLKECYKRIDKDLNNTSLCCVHGPTFPYARRTDASLPPSADATGTFGQLWILHDPRIARMYFDPFDDGCPFERLATLLACRDQHRDYTALLGDLDASSEWETLSTRLEYYTRRVQQLLVPHHGSLRSWDDRICRDVGTGRYVISAGLKRQYGHPSPDVVGAITEHVGGVT